MPRSYIVIIFILMMGCKPKKVDLTGEYKIDKKDFLSIFKPLALPYTVSDTNIDKSADTILIGIKALKQFFPDSAFPNLNKNNQPLKIYPVGMIDKIKEKYLLCIFAGNKKKQLLVFVLNDKNEFLAGKELLNNVKGSDYHHTLNINKEPTFLLSREKMGVNNNLLFTREGWIYNDAGIFMLVTKDSNEDPAKTAVINPIDTLPDLHKYSGNYFKDKKNYLSVRDGKDENQYLFFIHFEKNNGTCTAELKGSFKLTSVKTGQFTQNGDPCIIDFQFDGNSIRIKEQGSCGNHRGIKCFFDDIYIRKKHFKPKKSFLP